MTGIASCSRRSSDSLGHDPAWSNDPALRERLVNATGPLILVAASPGFGKSTLLAQWEAADRRTFAFVSLEPSENDPVELWYCIVTAVRQVLPSFGDSVEPMLHSVGGTAIKPLVERITAELDQLSDQVVVVLDDYHVIRNPVCHASVEALTKHPVGETRLALSTRADPPIPLGRLRASEELVEIRGSDLAFTLQEAEGFLNGAIGLGLSAGELAILQARTEGWPAGLYLAALGLRASADREQFLSSFGGSNRHIVDYLTEVVLDSVAGEARRFLLETSILSELSGPLCDAVTARDDSAVVLDTFERSNMFVISLDDQRLWYRYHQLFGELLHEQLALTMPDQVAGLHRAASGWCASAGRLDEAIGHAIAAADLQSAEDLVIGGWRPRAASGRLMTVLGWLEAFPDGYVRGSAPLSLISAWANGLLAHHDAARRSVSDMLTAGSASPAGSTGPAGPLPDGSATVEHAAALFRAMFSWTDVDELRLAAASVRTFRSELRRDFQAVATFAIGLAEFLGGNYEEARVQLQCAVELGMGIGAWIIVIDALGYSAQVALMQDRAGDAEILATRSVGEARAHGLADLPHAGYYLATLGAAMARSGRLEEGDALLDRGISQLADLAPLLAGHARLIRATVRRDLGDLDGARAQLDEARNSLAQCASTGIIGDLVQPVARALSAPHRGATEQPDLTERELSILGLLERGLSQREIAGQLFLSFHTVHSHIKSIYTRLGVTSREAALERAHELGLL